MMDSTVPPPPRAIRMKTGAIVGRTVLWLLVLACYIGIPYGMSREVARLQTLMESGKTVVGRVLSSRIVRGKSYAYYLSVAFSDRGFSYSGERPVFSTYYYKYCNQSEVPVVAMPNDPGDFEIGGVDPMQIDYARRQWLVPGGLWTFILTFFVIMFEVSLIRERSLLRRGQVAQGQVVSVIKGKGSAIKYRFDSRFGTREGKCSVSSTAKLAGFSEGVGIEILYDPNNDRSSIPAVLFQLVELA
ncbi:MAG: hypothetical protein P4L46_22135 [Fimbriimonas sp.]|nr:hypothetical protein [Fimbriimonas sp.]